MAFTQDQYDKLTEAIAQGAREVWYGDKRVQYHSLSDMLKLKSTMEAELGIGSNRTKSIKASFVKGLHK